SSWAYAAIVSAGGSLSLSGAPGKSIRNLRNRTRRGFSSSLLRSFASFASSGPGARLGDHVALQLVERGSSRECRGGLFRLPQHGPHVGEVDESVALDAEQIGLPRH